MSKNDAPAPVQTEQGQIRDGVSYHTPRGNDTNLRWARVDADLIPRIPGVKARALLALLSHLNAKTGRCDPSVDTLCKETRDSDRSIRRALKGLRKAGVIDWTERPGATSQYRLTPDQMVSPDNSVSPDDFDTAPRTDRSVTPDQMVSQTTEQCFKQNDDVGKNDNEENDSRAIIASKLKSLGLTKTQVEAALRGDLDVASAWAEAGEAGTPKNDIRRPLGYIVWAISEGVLPEQPKPQSQYAALPYLRDFTGAGRNTPSATPFYARGEFD